jgi:hypothetical protein
LLSERVTISGKKHGVFAVLPLGVDDSLLVPYFQLGPRAVQRLPDEAVESPSFADAHRPQHAFLVLSEARFDPILELGCAAVDLELFVFVEEQTLVFEGVVQQQFPGLEGQVQAHGPVGGGEEGDDLLGVVVGEAEGL